MAEPPASSEQELKRIIQYLAQIYQTQKKMGEQITALSQTVAGLQASGGSTQTTQQLAALNQRITQLQEFITKTGGGVSEAQMVPILQNLIETLDGRVRSIVAEMVIPEITASAAKSETAPSLAPAATSPAASSTPAATSPAGPRRPSDVPDHRVATVVESLQDVLVQLRRREKVPKEFLKELLEQARDTTMNNLASRAVAAGVFKEIIAITKSSPTEIPKQTLELILEKLDGLIFHIRKSQ